MQRGNGRVVVGSGHSHVGDPTHRADHADVRLGAPLRYCATQERQSTRTGATKGHVSGACFYLLRTIRDPLYALATAVLLV